MKQISSFHGLLHNLKNRLRSLAYPRQIIHDDCLDVASAAALLQISEFQFFHLAHMQWFGKSLPDNMMESFFSDYLFAEAIPHWVRQLSRKVLNLYKQGNLKLSDFNIERPVITPEMRAHGEWYIIMLLMLVVVFVVLISGYEPF